MAQGLFSLAQAKYSMGSLGQQQYDMDMKASAIVEVIEEGKWNPSVRLPVN